ncbi:MAG: L,D-transpeptidase, partial [Akkermansiaceae bacterium]
MKTLIPICLGLIAIVSLSSCASNLGEHRYTKFKTKPDYKKTREIYRDETLLKTANPSNTKVKIDLGDQRAQMLVGDKVALDLPCCTGKAGKRTPTGTFKITKKIRTKRSNIFGSLYRGSRKVYGGDRRKYRGRYTRYVGSPLPYW